MLGVSVVFCELILSRTMMIGVGRLQVKQLVVFAFFVVIMILIFTGPNVGRNRDPESLLSSGEKNHTSCHSVRKQKGHLTEKGANKRTLRLGDSMF